MCYGNVIDCWNGIRKYCDGFRITHLIEFLAQEKRQPPPLPGVRVPPMVLTFLLKSTRRRLWSEWQRNKTRRVESQSRLTSLDITRSSRNCILNSPRRIDVHTKQKRLRKTKHVRYCQQHLRFSSKWRFPVCYLQKLTCNYRNQEDIVGGVVKALRELIGWDWGQYGEAVFFVQGAYRSAGNNLNTFK